MTSNPYITRELKPDILEWVYAQPGMCIYTIAERLGMGGQSDKIIPIVQEMIRERMVNNRSLYKRRNSRQFPQNGRLNPESRIYPGTVPSGEINNK